MRRTAEKRSPCPVACTLDLIGDRWTLLVVRDLACGKRTFNDITRSPERIATNILADRLERLVEAGLVEKRASSEVAGRETYHLTPKGKSLGSVLTAIAEWGLKNVPGTKAHVTPAFD
jgi:DNA-binding HxlR family transcriptional regulator